MIVFCTVPGPMDLEWESVIAKKCFFLFFAMWVNPPRPSEGTCSVPSRRPIYAPSQDVLRFCGFMERYLWFLFRFNGFAEVLLSVFYYMCGALCERRVGSLAGPDMVVGNSGPPPGPPSDPLPSIGDLSFGSYFLVVIN